MEIALTPMEAKAFHLAVEGWSSAQIARMLGLGTRTIDNYLLHIYAKIGEISGNKRARLTYLFLTNQLTVI
jgi:DNA-binding NarL/FixJ family response regulator